MLVLLFHLAETVAKSQKIQSKPAKNILLNTYALCTAKEAAVPIPGLVRYVEWIMSSTKKWTIAVTIMTTTMTTITSIDQAALRIFLPFKEGSFN